MWTAEALLLWVHVIGFAEWWSAELVDKNSWILIEKKSVSDLKKALSDFGDIKRNRRLVSESIRKKLEKY